MTYKINGVELVLQPTTGRWLNRRRLGVSGSGHDVYSGIREFELKFNLEAPSDQNQLQDFYDQINVTGTAVIELPQYGASSYVFYAYSGCTISEPQQGNYFVGYIESVSLRLRVPIYP